MRRRPGANSILIVCLYVLCAVSVAKAQLGVRGQIFLPNGSPVQRAIRFTLQTDNGLRSEIYYTDSNGRIALPRINFLYTIVVETDGESYDTTTASFNPVHAGNYIVVNLAPLRNAKPSQPAIVRADALDVDVSPKAKQAYEEATKLLRSEKYDQATELLRQAISLKPNYVQAHNDLGAVYLKLNKLDQAAEVLHKAIKLNENWYLPQLNLGVVLNRQGKHKEAAGLLVKLLSDHPDQTKIHLPLIEALIGAQQWQEAEEELNRAVALKGADLVDLKIKLGMVMIKQGKSGAAVDILYEASRAEPDNALAQFSLGTALLQIGSLDPAETALRRAYEIKGSEMPGAQLLLGELYFQKKDYSKAIEAFKAYLRDLPTAPNAAQVKEAIDRLRQAAAKQ